jgi:hypothetical protein
MGTSWLFYLLLLALPLPGADNYPPDGVRLIQATGTVPLRWQIPGRQFHVQVRQDSQLLLDVVTASQEQSVTVKRDGPVSWSVRNERGEATGGTFSVPSEFVLRLDGPDGQAGTWLRGKWRGRAGGPGGMARVKLSRDVHGMHLWIQEPRPTAHYLFASQGMKFTLSARGGDGASASLHRYDQPRPPLPATAGGNGGLVFITTNHAPWRDYLKVDVGQGTGGTLTIKYDKGHEMDVHSGIETVKAPDGRAGRVITSIDP